MPDADLRDLSWQFDNRAFNEGDLSVIDELISADFVNRTPLPGQGTDRDAIRDYIPRFREGFPDLKCHNRLMLAQDDLVAHIIVFEGTHTGTFLDVPPTGRRISMPSYDFQRWADGLMVERWSTADSADMDAIMAQNS